MKNLLLKIVLGLAIQIAVSGCVEFEGVPNFIGGWGGSDGWSYDSIYFAPLDTTYHPGFYIDSLSQTGKSAVTMWAHILYDTVLVINARSAYAGYVDQPADEGYSIIQSQPDTIDFRLLSDTTSIRGGRMEWIYKYKVEMDSLNSATLYWFCTITDYTEYKGGWLWLADYKCTDYFELK